MLRDSSRYNNWKPTLFVILSLVILYESIQRNPQDATVPSGPHDAPIGKERAHTVCKMIVQRFDFLTTLFQLKYNSRCSELYSRRNEHTVALDEATMGFVWRLC